MSLEEGKIIKAARKRLKYTQIQFANHVGISVDPIHRLENGQEGISLDNLRKITEAVGMEVVIRDKHGSVT